MALTEAIEDIDIAFRQLEFSIKLLSYCEAGKIDPAEFDTDHLVALHNGDLHFPTQNFTDRASIERAAGTSVLIAASASAIALNRGFEVAEIEADPTAGDNVVRIRTLIYMVRCAFAHDIAAPLWEVRGKYRQTLNVEIEGQPLALDLATLDGQPFEIDAIGGYVTWYGVYRMAVARLGSLV
jgi:hypothetical protein